MKYLGDIYRRATQLIVIWTIAAIAIAFSVIPGNGSTMKNDGNLVNRLFDESGKDFCSKKTFAYSLNKSKTDDFYHNPLFDCKSEYFIPLDKFELKHNVSRLHRIKEKTWITYSNIIYADLYLSKLIEEYLSIEEKSRRLEYQISVSPSFNIYRSDSISKKRNELIKKYKSFHQSIFYSRRNEFFEKSINEDIVALRKMLAKGTKNEDDDEATLGEKSGRINAGINLDKKIDDDDNASLGQYSHIADYRRDRSGTDSELPWIIRMAIKFIKICMKMDN